jgi:arylsulfatase
MLKTNLINRRKFLKNGSKTLLGVTTSISFPSIIRSKSSQNPPNIVFIICDQMRGDALSCLGSSNARTPHLDKMAREGVLFKNCFANNPVCLPSRKSFFSGLYPHQHGSLTNNSGQSLPTLEGTLLGYLKQKGYRTGWIGKNHTYSNQALKGLDVTSIRAREPFRAYSKYVPPFWHSDTLWPEEECYPRKNTDEGIQFIQSSKKNQPFFLHLSYFDPHPPYMAPSEFSCRYNSKDMTIPPFISPDKLSPRLAEHARALHYDRIKDSDLTETMRYYYAAIEWGVDFQVGRILKSLETNGLLENTIVIFI